MEAIAHPPVISGLVFEDIWCLKEVPGFDAGNSKMKNYLFNG